MELKALTKMKPSKKTMKWLEDMAEHFISHGYAVKGYGWCEEGFTLQLEDIILSNK
jgi:hypothetical protein